MSGPPRTSSSGAARALFLELTAVEVDVHTGHVPHTRERASKKRRQAWFQACANHSSGAKAAPRHTRAQGLEAAA